jgi:hypothetical protein
VLLLTGEGASGSVSQWIAFPDNEQMTDEIRIDVLEMYTLRDGVASE